MYIGYVKNSTSYCSSHIIGYDSLLQVVKGDLKKLITDNIRPETFYGAVYTKANEQHINSIPNTLKELASITKRLKKLNNDFRIYCNSKSYLHNTVQSTE